MKTGKKQSTLGDSSGSLNVDVSNHPHYNAVERSDNGVRRSGNRNVDLINCEVNYE